MLIPSSLVHSFIHPPIHSSIHHPSISPSHPILSHPILSIHPDYNLSCPGCVSLPGLSPCWNSWVVALGEPVCVLGDGWSWSPTGSLRLLALVCCPARSGAVRIKESAGHAGKHEGSWGEMARVFLCDKGICLLLVCVQTVGCSCVCGAGGSVWR